MNPVRRLMVSLVVSAGLFLSPVAVRFTPHQSFSAESVNHYEQLMEAGGCDVKHPTPETFSLSNCLMVSVMAHAQEWAEYIDFSAVAEAAGKLKLMVRVHDYTVDGSWQPYVQQGTYDWDALLGKRGIIRYVRETPVPCSALSPAKDGVAVCENDVLGTSGPDGQAADASMIRKDRTKKKVIHERGLIRIFIPPPTHVTPLFVVAHELGHELGLPHQDPNVDSVMVQSGSYFYQKTQASSTDVKNVLKKIPKPVKAKGKGKQSHKKGNGHGGHGKGKGGKGGKKGGRNAGYFEPAFVPHSHNY